jgi:hypothetical protein
MNRMALVIVGLAALLSPGPSVWLAQSLNAEQAACEELQMERLERRFAGYGENDSILLWRASPAGGRFEGVFVPLGIRLTSEGFTRDERQVSFEILFKEGAFLLNPARLPLPETTLMRRDVESNGRPLIAEVPFDFTFETAGGPGNPIFPRLPVGISGVLGNRSAAQVGRGPLEDDLLSSCGPEPSLEEAKVLRILARTLRPTCWVNFGCSFSPYRYKVTLVRTSESRTYRANIYPVGHACKGDEPPGTCPVEGTARLALEFDFDAPVDGRLQGGTVRILPLCSVGQEVGCTRPEVGGLGIFIVPPIWAGHETQSSEVLARGALLLYSVEGSPENVLSANLDWADLLRDTTWNSGFE